MTTRHDLINTFSRTGVRGLIVDGMFDNLLDVPVSPTNLTKPLSREFAIFGDSRTAQCHTIAATAFSTENYGYAFWAAQVAGGFCPTTYNFGVGGDTTGMMLARISAVVACPADIILFMGGTNDRTGGMTVADTKRNITAIVRRLQKAGKIVIVGNDTPRFATKALTAPQQVDHETIRDWIINELSEITPVADTYSLIVQSDLHDDLHVNIKGAYKVGALGFGPVLAQYVNLGVDLPTESADLFSVNNITGSLTANPLMTGSVTQSTGSVNPVAGSVVATGFKGAGSSFTGLTTQWSKEVAQYGESQVIKFGGTPTSAGAYIAVSPTATFTLANLSAGNVISLMAVYDLVGDGLGILGVTAELLVTKPVASVSTTIYYRDGDKYVDPHSMPTGTITGALDTQRYTVDGTETAIVTRISIYFAQNVPQNSTVKLRQFAVRKHVG
jgi:lysophospholipase L1-like esterase